MKYFPVERLQKLAAGGNWEKFQKVLTKEHTRFLVGPWRSIDSEPNLEVVESILLQGALFQICSGIASGATGDARPLTGTGDSTPLALINVDEGCKTLTELHDAVLRNADLLSDAKREFYFAVNTTPTKHRLALSISAPGSASWQQHWKEFGKDFLPLLSKAN